MNVNATNAVASASTAAAGKTTAATPTLSYDSYLSLLLAELKNQDPTKPMDATQTVTQLATVSNVGQAVKLNNTLSSLLTATYLTQAEALIGKTVTSADGATQGEVASVAVGDADVSLILADGSTLALASGVRISGP
jgi:flagellar basal-body rod modification protein FlgD